MGKQKGFSLIELMIAVAVVGILASIAYPSYLDFVRKANRGEAQGSILELAQWMERQFTVNGTYQPGGANPTLPFTTSPKDGGATTYIYTLSNMGASTFTITGTAQGDQANDDCGNISVTQTGTRSSTGSGGDCW